MLSRGFVPRTALPSRNVTTPVGCWGDCSVFTTLAVNVTVCPLVVGFALDASVVAVVACAGWITWFSTVLVDEAEFGVAPYAAVIAWVPTDSVETDSVAAPLEVSVVVPKMFFPSKKRTDPEGTPCAPCTVAVKVTFCPYITELVVLAMLVVVES